MRFDFRSVCLVVLTTALGLTCVQVANQRALNGGSYGSSLIFLWVGLIFIFIPIAVRVTNLLSSYSGQIRIMLTGPVHVHAT
jgi:hypothetical protein